MDESVQNRESLGVRTMHRQGHDLERSVLHSAAQQALPDSGLRMCPRAIPQDVPSRTISLKWPR